MSGQFQVGDLVHVVQDGDAPCVPECILFEIRSFFFKGAPSREPLADLREAKEAPDCLRLKFWAPVRRLRHAGKQEWDKEEI